MKKWQVLATLLAMLALPQKTHAQTAIHMLYVDSATTAWALDLYNHYPDHETVLCVYGIVRSDTAWVGMFHPPHIIESTRTTVKYNRCAPLPPQMFGILQFVGMVHTHAEPGLPDGGCWFSLIDHNSFIASNDALVDMVICQRGVIWVGRDSK